MSPAQNTNSRPLTRETPSPLQSVLVEDPGRAEQELSGGVSKAGPELGVAWEYRLKKEGVGK